MQTGTGISINRKIAIGRIRWCGRQDGDAPEQPSDRSPEEEWTCLEHALDAVKRQQRQLGETAARTAGGACAELFGSYAEILEDETLLSALNHQIFQEGCTAREAVRREFGRIGQQFHEMEDPYFRAREADILGLRDALRDALREKETEEEAEQETVQKGAVCEPLILAGEDFTPSETIRFERSTLAGLAVRKGSEYSHTAILARAMDLPALIHCSGLTPEWNGKLAILNGQEGVIYIDPTEEKLAAARELARREEKTEQALGALRDLPTVTPDGKKMILGANVASLSEAVEARSNGAEEIGLFRSEFLYLNEEKEPEEEKQFQVYRKVLEEFSPKRVVIRTCDLGADKIADYVVQRKEENPALGLRGIRLCLENKDFFKRQLRALLRASAYGNLEIMLPMITSAWEIRECRELLAECRRELEEEGLPVAERIPLGIIVETPAAALCAEELAKEADFFSIGTNDLVQYTCAADRQNQSLGKFFEPRHPAVLQEIRMTVEAAKKNHIRVGICGELGADPDMTEQWIDMGIDELSVHPSAILPLRQKIRSLKPEPQPRSR